LGHNTGLGQKDRKPAIHLAQRLGNMGNSLVLIILAGWAHFWAQLAQRAGDQRKWHGRSIFQESFRALWRTKFSINIIAIMRWIDSRLNRLGHIIFRPGWDAAGKCKIFK